MKNQIMAIKRSNASGAKVLAVEAYLDSKDKKKDPLELSNMSRFVVRAIEKTDKTTKLMANVPAKDVSLISFRTKKAMGMTMDGKDFKTTIYDSGAKYMRITNDDGLNLIYMLKVEYDTSRKYRVTVSLENCYAPVETKAGGQTLIKMAEKKDSERVALFISEEEWYSLVERMADVFAEYRAMTFPAAFSAATSEE